MDIKVSGVDVAYIKEIDRKAKEISDKLGRKFSRNEYIKMLIQKDSELRLMQLKEDKFDEATNNLKVTLEKQERKLQEFIDSNNRLLLAMASGIDLSDKVGEL